MDRHYSSRQKEAFDGKLAADVKALLAVQEEEEPRIDLALFLAQEGWPARYIVHVVGEFGKAVKRRYEAVHGDVPPREHDDAGRMVNAYRGHSDFLLIADTYRDEMGALVEQVFGVPRHEPKHPDRRWKVWFTSEGADRTMWVGQYFSDRAYPFCNLGFEHVRLFVENVASKPDDYFSMSLAELGHTAPLTPGMVLGGVL
jgi:hypothetical protein